MKAADKAGSRGRQLLSLGGGAADDPAGHHAAGAACPVITSLIQLKHTIYVTKGTGVPHSTSACGDSSRLLPASSTQCDSASPAAVLRSKAAASLLVALQLAFRFAWQRALPASSVRMRSARIACQI
jgi:hypothetical protein